MLQFVRNVGFVWHNADRTLFMAALSAPFRMWCPRLWITIGSNLPFPRADKTTGAGPGRPAKRSFTPSLALDGIETGAPGRVLTVDRQC